MMSSYSLISDKKAKALHTTTAARARGSKPQLPEQEAQSATNRSRHADADTRQLEAQARRTAEMECHQARHLRLRARKCLGSRVFQATAC